jgi:predicted nuclease of predicted toxin-antitoxin system
VRFLADENIPRLLVELLTHADFDVIYAAEINPAAPDTEIADLAFKTGRVVITQDQDFSDIATTSPSGFHGLILLNLDPLSNKVKASRAFDVIKSMGEEANGGILVIEPSRVRIRKLDRAKTSH